MFLAVRRSKIKICFGVLKQIFIILFHIIDSERERIKNMKKIRKRLAALMLAVTMVIPTNIASFAADASVQTQENETQDEQTNESSDAQDEQSNTEQSKESETSESNAASAQTESQTSDSGNVTGDVTTTSESSETATTGTNVEGTVIVDENNDDVEIKKSDKPYLALGADLSEQQRSTVLSLMGIDAANLENYDVVYITNSEEHQYLDSYIESSKIGTRSLSSVVIVKRDKGNGLNISTKNISYCTVGMYKNALATAGITDADIIVAGPTPISGTAALVGIFKAYEEMTGEAVQENVVDTALNELVVTGKLEDSIQGLTDEEVEEFIAYIKSVIAKKNLTDEASINEVIDEACSKYGVTLSDDERQMIIDLLLKITSMGIDLSGLVDYASSLYNSFKNGESSSGVMSSVGTFVKNIFSAVGNFFKSLFGK